MYEKYAPDRGHFLDFQIESAARTPTTAGGPASSTRLPVKSPLRGVDPMDRPVGPDDHGARCAEH